MNQVVYFLWWAGGAHVELEAVLPANRKNDDAVTLMNAKSWRVVALG